MSFRCTAVWALSRGLDYFDYQFFFPLCAFLDLIFVEVGLDRSWHLGQATRGGAPWRFGVARGWVVWLIGDLASGWLGFGRVGLAGDLAQVGQATGFGKAWAAGFAWI